MNRNLLLLITGNSISVFGSGLFLVVLFLFLKDLAGSASIIGLLQFLAFLPGILLSPLSGALADSLDKKRILIFSDTIRGFLMVFLAAVGFLGRMRIWILLLTTVSLSIGGTLFLPSVNSLIPTLVSRSRLKGANAVRGAFVQIANLAGSAIGGILYMTIGPALIFLINGITFFISAAEEKFIKTPKRSHTPLSFRMRLTILRRDTYAGIRYLAGKKGMRNLIFVHALINFLYPPLILSLPFVVEKILGLDDSYFGYFLATLLAGGIAGY